MKLFSSNARVSFQAKVLVPVITVMVALTAVTIWLVNERISAQLEDQATLQLDNYHAIFTKLQENRNSNLVSKDRSIGADARYIAFIRSADDSPAWYRTLNAFLPGQIRENGATIVTCTLSSDSAHEFASASQNPQLDTRQFQARSTAANQPRF